MYNDGLIGNRKSQGESPDFRLPTSDLAITPYIPYVTNFSPTSDFRLLTSDFRPPTSNFGLQSFHHFPPLSSKWARFLLLEFSARAQALIFLEIEPIMTANSDTPGYRNILNMRRIVNIPNTTMCSLTETAPLIERVRSAIEFPWSCAPLT